MRNATYLEDNAFYRGYQKIQNFWHSVTCCNYTITLPMTYQINTIQFQLEGNSNQERNLLQCIGFFTSYQKNQKFWQSIACCNDTIIFLMSYQMKTQFQLEGNSSQERNLLEGIIFYSSYQKNQNFRHSITCCNDTIILQMTYQMKTIQF